MAGRRSRASSGTNARQAARMTTRDQAQDELREREAAYNAVLTPIPEMVFRIRRDGTFLDFVPAKGQPPTLRASELVGRKVQDVLPPDIAKQAMAIGERTLRTGAFQSFEYQLRVPQPDGELTSYQARLIPAGPDEVVAIIGNTTQRRRMELALRESEERYRALFEKSSDGLALVIDGRIVLVNPRMQEITGFTQEELFGRTPQELVPTEEREQIRERIGELSAGRPERPARYRIQRKDGDLIPVEVISRAIEHHGGNAILSTLRDISERVRAEEALNESEERWRSLAESAPDFIITVDREGAIQFINRTVLGLARDDVIGTNIFDYVDTEYRRATRNSLEQVFKSGEPSSQEVRLVEEMGSVWYRSHIGPVRRNGQVVAATIVAADITDRKRIEEALRESEERFRSLSEVSFEGIAIHEDGIIIDANNAFAALAGYDRSEVIGMHALDFTAAEYHEAVTENIRAGGEDPYEVMALRKDGTRFPVELRGRTVPMEGRTVRVVAIRDLTRLKEAAAKLQQAREELEGKIERQMVRRNPYGLTFREFTVLHHVATGKADKEIARELGISPLTVQKHVASILAKMNASSRTEAGVRAVREALLD